jgi:hypothetical protein
VSKSAKACEASLTDESIEVNTPYIYGYFASMCKMALYVALKLRGYPNSAYEFNHAVCRATSIDDAEVRWINGEDIFDGVQSDPTRGPEITQMIATLERMAIEQMKALI